MAWVILEGLDRTGKSSAAKVYEEKGYRVVHMDAPDKQYLDSKYVGPNYLDECVDLYMSLNGQDVVFDRSVYGEFVWPDVYTRRPQLSTEDLEILQEIEDANDCQRIIMHDENFDAHWQRCVENKEPLTRAQFNKAVAYFNRLSNMHGFQKQTLNDYADGLKELKTTEVKDEKSNKADIVAKISPTKTSNQQLKLEKANAINSILALKIIKKKGNIFEAIEKDIRLFLQDKLGTILGNEEPNKLTTEEIKVLKIMAQRIVEKQGK